MENLKIKDFNTAFAIGIDKLVEDSIRDLNKKKKLKSKLKLKKAVKLLQKSIFVKVFFNILAQTWYLRKGCG